MSRFKNSESALLFDYNGVIVDDEAIHEEAFRATLKKMNLSLTDDMYRDYCLGRTDADGFRALAETNLGAFKGVSIQKLVDDKGNQYRRLIKDRKVFYPGIVQTLEELSHHFKIAIVTSSHRADVAAAINNTIIPTLIQFILTAEDVINGKPDPEGYLLGAKRLGISRDCIVVVEDSMSGVLAAISAGIRCIAVKQTTSDEYLSIANMILGKTTDITTKIIERVLSDEITHE
ncbi:MAG: hypothetical protein BA863_18230 [Desulfovibrio sp. S3730MH75]|nr:MAG: hypothetical protein BA863_18230 [Desulfovibrio sp. S3730MH75]